MFQLYYVSTAASHVTEEIATEIAAVSAGKNRERGVTGILAYDGPSFAQVLEGDEDVVNDLVATIERDKRHSGLVILKTRHVKERSFPTWNMQKLDTQAFYDFIHASL